MKDSTALKFSDKTSFGDGDDFGPDELEFIAIAPALNGNILRITTIESEEVFVYNHLDGSDLLQHIADTLGIRNVRITELKALDEE